MSEMLDFTLTPEKIPKVEREFAKRGSKYDAVLDQFLESDSKSVRVGAKGVTSQTLLIGLRTRIKVRKLSLTVLQRENKIYLKKKE